MSGEWLLFDMDGVLLRPGAYHRALQDSVALVAQALGFGQVKLVGEDIAVFEAQGVSSEWDTAAICAALLLVKAWRSDPQRRLPPTLERMDAPANGLAPPDFSTFASRLGLGQQPGQMPLLAAEERILRENTGLDVSQRQQLTSILRGARSARQSPVHRAFQEMVLGSRVYARTYGYPPRLNVESYLQRFDHPLLPAPGRRKLERWLADGNHAAAIFTSRPSTPPAGSFNTPEAELGAGLVGLGTLPIAGLGGLQALAEQRGLPLQSGLKPSPMHALTATLLASGVELDSALQASADLALERRETPLLARLHNGRVTVFEDTPNGLYSARRAQELLAQAGIRLSLRLLGVSEHPDKRTALETAGARVFSNLSQALQVVL